MSIRVEADSQIITFDSLNGPIRWKENRVYTSACKVGGDTYHVRCIELTSHAAILWTLSNEIVIGVY